jgi:hypothetical protein
MVAFMEEQSEWEGPPKELLHQLQGLADKHNIAIRAQGGCGSARS